MAGNVTTARAPFGSSKDSDKTSFRQIPYFLSTIDHITCFVRFTISVKLYMCSSRHPKALSWAVGLLLPISCLTQGTYGYRPPAGGEAAPSMFQANVSTSSAPQPLPQAWSCGPPTGFVSGGRAHLLPACPCKRLCLRWGLLKTVHLSNTWHQPWSNPAGWHLHFQVGSVLCYREAS